MHQKRGFTCLQKCTFNVIIIAIDLSCREETAKFQRELDEKRMFLTLESEKVLKAERELFLVEKSVEKLRAQNSKLKMDFDELQLKYEPGMYHVEIGIFYFYTCFSHCISSAEISSRMLPSILDNYVVLRYSHF